MGKKPTKCISKDEAKELHDQWSSKRGGHLKNNLGFEDARDFWWSVDELQEYLDYVKEESAKQGIKNPGIRVYLGAYPKNKCKMGKGYSTLFLAPTGAKIGASGKDGLGGASNNYNIPPFNHSSGGHPPNNY